MLANASTAAGKPVIVTDVAPGTNAIAVAFHVAQVVAVTELQMHPICPFSVVRAQRLSNTRSSVCNTFRWSRVT